jgi:hypothetical protein
VEVFRRTNKPLTITGLTLNPSIRELADIDKVINWAVIWGERRRAAAAAAAPPVVGNSFNGGNGCGYSVEQIEQIVREGAPDGKNRSDLFHTIVGHYIGCGWSAEKILEHLQRFPSGIGGRYLGEGRLSGEIARCANKFAAGALPLSDTNGWTNGFQTKAPASDPSKSDEELEELDDDSEAEGEEPSPSPQDIDLGADQELDEEESPALDPELNDEPIIEDETLAPDPELDDELLDGDFAEDGPPAQNPNLPTLYCHGDPDPRPLKSCASSI